MSTLKSRSSHDKRLMKRRIHRALRCRPQHGCRPSKRRLPIPSGSLKDHFRELEYSR